MTFVKKGVVISLGSSGDFDDYYIYDPAILKHNGCFYLYYTGFNGSEYRIGLAISKDGITFVKKGVVVPLGDSGDFDDYSVYHSTILKHNGRFYLYYSSCDGSKYRIGLAISKDGITFVKKGVVVPKGASGEFDDSRTLHPAILKHNGRFYLYYIGFDGSKYRIGLAISKDGITFVKKGVVVPLGGSNEFDDVHLYFPSILKHNGRFYLYYAAFDGSKYRIGLAISKDGITFVKKGVVVPLGDSGDFDDVRTHYPAILKHNGRFYLYYMGYDISKRRIGLAISKDSL